MWREGLLGNRTLIFDDVEQALAHRPALDKIGFRESKRGGGGAWTLEERKDARHVAELWKNAGRTFIMDGSVPNDKSTLQGEVCRTHEGLVGFLCCRQWIWGTVYEIDTKTGEMVSTSLGPSGLPPMRETIRRGWHRHTSYLETRMLLARYMDPSSRDDLDALLEMYPDATVEFTCFDVNVGVFPRRNTIFWETRNY